MEFKKTRWLISTKKADFYGLAEKLNIDPVIARLIRNRDVVEEKDYDSYLNPNIKNIPEESLLTDMDLSVNIILEHIENNKHIRIIGDYDTDGTCATYILYKGLKELGGVVDFYIPDRIADGYGLNSDIVKKSKADNVDLIITCDNGISAIEEIDLSVKLGLNVIVTDHHQLRYIEDEIGNREYIMPNALAVVNPHRYDDKYPFKMICGAYIAFKLIKRLFEVKKHISTLLEDELKYFAAIATVGDIMPLSNENRIFVKNVTATFKSCKNTGLITLCNNLELDLNNISSYHIGFRISPTINASGRLSTAKTVLNLFIEENAEKASFLANELIALNEKRKGITEREAKKATEIVLKMDNKYKVIVVFLEDCHESIAGIVAARIKESFNRPVFVVTRSKEGMLKGSGRSIDKYNMFEEMTKIKDIFTHYGGHKMAAGFSFSEDRLDEFRERLNENTTLSDDDLIEDIVLDLRLPLYYLSIDLVEQLSLLEPFGMGNKKPTFAEKDVEILSIKRIGKENQYMKLRLDNTKNGSIYAVLFNNVDKFESLIIEKYGENCFKSLISDKKCGVKASFIYYPNINEYKGNRDVEIIINDFIV